MSLSRLENSEKTMKKRLIKSPTASSAAETILLLTKQFDKPDLDIHTNHYTTRRNDSDLIQKSMKRAHSSSIIKILTEKNQEIKKLQEEKNALVSQLSELSGTVKKYYKVRAILKEKDLIIESLKGFKASEQVKSRKNSKKKRKPLRIHSRLSIDGDCVNGEIFNVRPNSAANHVAKQTPRRLKCENKFSEFNGEMKDLLLKTEKILKGWKKSFKGKK